MGFWGSLLGPKPAPVADPVPTVDEHAPPVAPASVEGRGFTISPAQLGLCMPHNPSAGIWAAAFNRAFAQFGVLTARQAAALLAQCGHESGDCVHLRENLNYTSPERLKAVFPRGFPAHDPAEYVGDPEKLANLVYANIMGNGGPETGDGYRYAGLGAGQLTGRTNMAGFGLAVGMTPEDASAYCLTPDGAAASAAWYFQRTGCDVAAEHGDFEFVCARWAGVRVLSPGMKQTISYESDRLPRWHRCCSVLGTLP